MFYHIGKTDHCTHIKGLVSQYSVESEYNAACNAGIAPENFRMLNNELLNKDPYVVPEQAPLVILDRKSAICVANNYKDTKQTRHISRITIFKRKCEYCNFHKIVWYEVGLQLADIGTKNVR